MMYDKLVKNLRDVEEMLKAAQFKEATNLIDQAVDAIENLELTCNRYEKDYKDLCTHLLNCGLKLSKPEPLTVKEIGSIIRTERIRKGLSCRELAELSNTSAATVCRLETGKRKGSTKAALKILKALGIESEIVEEKTAESIVDKIEFAIIASTGTDEYMVGFRNGLRYALYLLDGKAPQYEFITIEDTDP